MHGWKRWLSLMALRRWLFLMDKGVTDGAAVTAQSKMMATLAEGERKKCNGQRPAIEDH
jgi:hypothetical protein